MTAKLIRTTYYTEVARVDVFVRLTVQGVDSEFRVEIPEADLLANAAADNRDDWKTTDCAALATHIAGVTVTID